MPTRWESYPVEMQGGLVTNYPLLQHGLKKPGAPRILRNFEPSLRGGYRRINGYNKYSETVLDPYGTVYVQGSGQSGTSLLVANLFAEVQVGDTLTVAGVTGTYTVTAVTFSEADNDATLTLNSSLASSPADQAVVTFTNNANPAQGIWVGELNDSLEVLVARGGNVYRENSGWSKINTPTYGTVVVNGGGQTGTTLNINGISSDDYGLTVGDTFTIAGIEKVYTVKTAGAVSSGAETITIDPALASSPSNGAALTFLSTRFDGTDRIRFHKFNFDGSDKVLICDGSNYPGAWDGTTYDEINGSTDVQGASFGVDFKNHLFFAKGSLLSWTAPTTQNDFDTGNGAGSIRVPADITGLIVFREQLIIFTYDAVHRLTGSSEADFALSNISTKLGCIHPDTIQEVSGDIMYVGPDGVRTLGATERIGDFSLMITSENIRDDMVDFLSEWTEYSSVVVRTKNQYRVFGYTDGTLSQDTKGFLVTQYSDQNFDPFQWAELKGIPSRVSASGFVNDTDYIVFANTDGYVYRMDVGSNFDGGDILAKMSTPFMSINDPSYRKTFYRLHTYYDAEDTVSYTLRLTFDFQDLDKIQPSTFQVEGGGTYTRYGSAIYGTSTYGATPKYYDKSIVVGAGFQVSVEYTFNDTSEPFTIGTILLEYATEDRN